jgi:Na+/H+-translocating membrane pyrophosphatase
VLAHLGHFLPFGLQGFLPNIYHMIFISISFSYVFSKDDGSPEMRAVSDPIREGAEGFLRVQYSAIFRMAFALAAVILLSYSLRPDSKSQGGVDKLGSVMLGIISCASFGIGAGCSATAGYVSMWVSASSNIRVASAARRSYQECLEICFRGGAFSAVLCITLCVFGVSMLYIVLSVLFVNSGLLTPSGYSSLRDFRVHSCYCRCSNYHGWIWFRGLICCSLYATWRWYLHKGC